MPPAFNESTLLLATRAWLAALGYSVLHGPEIAPGAAAANARASAFVP